MSRTNRALASWLAAAALLGGAVAGCGGKAEDSGETSSGGEAGSIKTGPGITEKEISLGLLTDLSGVFAVLAKPIVQGTQEYWKQQNAACAPATTVKLVVKDHGYDPQKAVVQYRDMRRRSPAFQQLLGSPITAALLPTLKSDRQFAILLRRGRRRCWPTTSCSRSARRTRVEIINGLDYLKEQGKIKDGDKIGHVYFEGEYGEAGLAGSKYFAGEHGMEVVEQKIQPTDEDMSGQVVALKRAGVKTIVVTTGPKQLASIAGIAASQGFNVPILGENPTFDPALMASPAVKALKANVIISGPVDLFASDNPATKKVSDAYLAEHGNKNAKAAVQLGYAPEQGDVRGAQQGVREQRPHEGGPDQGHARALRPRHRRHRRRPAGLLQGRRSPDTRRLHVAAGLCAGRSGGRAGGRGDRRGKVLRRGRRPVAARAGSRDPARPLTR